MMEISKQIVMKKIADVKPYIRNPRKNDKTIELLVDIIPKVGFNVPIVIDTQGVIVKGHARYCAAIRLGMDEIPCIVTHADEETIKLDRLADNKISEFTDWIDDELLHELDMLNTDFDLASIGFEAMYEPVFQSFSNAPEEQESVSQVNSAEAEKERRKKYMDFLSQFVPEESSVQITTQDAIRKAQAAQENIPAPKARYSKVVCEHCGHVMFIREGDAVFVEQ